jgi:hypothetical protein
MAGDRVDAAARVLPALSSMTWREGRAREEA